MSFRPTERPKECAPIRGNLSTNRIIYIYFLLLMESSYSDFEVGLSGSHCRFSLTISYDQDQLAFRPERHNSDSRELIQQAITLTGYSKYYLALTDNDRLGHCCCLCDSRSLDEELWAVFSFCFSPDHVAFQKARNLSQEYLNEYFGSIRVLKLRCDLGLESSKPIPIPSKLLDEQFRKGNSYHEAYFTSIISFIIFNSFKIIL